MTANPLKHLGLDPSLFKGMDQAAARAMVRAVIQAQLRVTHPDQGGDERKFQRISALQDAVKDEQAFVEALGIFLRPRKDQLTILQEQNRKLRRLAQHHEQRAQNFALGHLSDQLTVSCGLAYKVRLTDKVKHELSNKDVDSSVFVTLDVDATGAMQMTRSNKTVAVSRRIVGSIARDQNVGQLMKDSQPERPDLLLNGGRQSSIGVIEGRTRGSVVGTNRVLVEHARPILRRLQPLVVDNCHLFSAQTIEEKDYLYYEGITSSVTVSPSDV